ncbi:MAG: hypothetical protein JW772_04480 [Candidatus Diapherotrites archaeon]|nr:hypothetical protein [Candidatus Diapherotrites archaeon]
MLKEKNCLQTFESIKRAFMKKTGVRISEKEFLARLKIIKNILRRRGRKKTFFVGIGGGNGTGKTSLGVLLELVLREMNFKVVRVSFDDFYKSAKERKRLAKKYPGNPLYQIARGIPGTHRIKLLENVMEKAKKGKSFDLPFFDKSAKNGFGKISKRIRKVSGRVDFFILDGCWIGLPKIKIKNFLGEIEKNNFVNRTVGELGLKGDDFAGPLAFLGEYKRVFSRLDFVAVIVPERIEWTIEWRIEQEQRLRKRKRQGMTNAQIKEFVKHWLPFMVLYEKSKADAIIFTCKNHRIKKIKFRGQESN